jgi:hypothetical protein
VLKWMKRVTEKGNWKRNPYDWRKIYYGKKEH